MLPSATCTIYSTSLPRKSSAVRYFCLIPMEGYCRNATVRNLYHLLDQPSSEVVQSEASSTCTSFMEWRMRVADKLFLTVPHSGVCAVKLFLTVPHSGVGAEKLFLTVPHSEVGADGTANGIAGRCHLTSASSTGAELVPLKRRFSHAKCRCVSSSSVIHASLLGRPRRNEVFYCCA
jgi:hypothetical protein